MSDADTQPPTDLDAWRRRVDAELAGTPFDKLRAHLLEGLVVEPLYATLPASPTGSYDPLAAPTPTLAPRPEPRADPVLGPILGAAPAFDPASALDGAICIDLSALELAGAHAVDELAAALLATTRWLELAHEHDREPLAVAARLVFRVGVGPDLLWQIAKLRALRLVVRRLLELAAPRAEPLPEPRIHALTSARTFTVHDPWTNLLRNTASVFAAVVGGADDITPLPFDLTLATPSRDAERLAENTVHLALHEAHLARIEDPAAGSFALEAWTDALCAAAWDRFSRFQAQGGLAGAGAPALAASVRESHAAREVRARKRQDGLIGTSLFPNLDEVLPAPPAPDALASPRLAAPFERLRAAALAVTRAPRALLVNLGPVAEHLARATWVKGFVEAGGLRAIDCVVHPIGDAELATLESALAAHDARVAIVSAADAHLGTHVVAATAALTRAGAHVLVAGRPGPHEAALRDAGARGFIHVGVDVVSTLTDLLRIEGAAL